MQGGSWRMERNVLPTLPPQRDALWLDVPQSTPQSTPQSMPHILPHSVERSGEWSSRGWRGRQRGDSEWLVAVGAVGPAASPKEECGTYLGAQCGTAGLLWRWRRERAAGWRRERERGCERHGRPEAPRGGGVPARSTPQST
eukprot:2135471-Prymnesium_polylepis.1